MRSVSPAEGSEASTFTVPNLGRHPHHQRVKLHVGAAKQDGWTRRGPRPQSLRDGGDSDSADHLPIAPPEGELFPIPLSPAAAEMPDPSQYLPLRGRCRSLPLRRQQRGRAGGQPELRGGLPLSRCATAPPQGERFPTDGDRIPPTTQCGQRGQMPKAEGESWRSAGVARWPPPQSLRDSSPSGGAISDRWESDSADHSLWSAGVARWPPPQSLRDSSPRGERFPIPLSPAEGESVAVSGGLRGAPAHRP